MSVTIDVMTLRDVLHVCENMRLSDWGEVINLVPASITTPEQIALLTMQVSRLGLCAKVDGEPAIIVQFVEVLDGTWRVGMFGTDRFAEAARPMVRELQRITLPHVLDLGATYCEAFSDPLHPEAARLLEFMGFAKIALLPEYGSRGRDIALYVLTRRQANVLRHGRRRIHSGSAPADAPGSGGDRHATGIPKAAGQPDEPL